MNNNTDREYEALVENYEDALMRIVMYQVAQEDGKRLLEELEELKNSGFEVPEELDKKCIKLIQSACAPQERKQVPAMAGTCKKESPRRLRLYTAGRMLMVAILAAVVLFCAAYAANEQFRVDTLNFFLELQENGTRLYFDFGGLETRRPSTINGEFAFEFTYIPEGFELYKQEVIDMKAYGTGFFSGYQCPDDEYSNFDFYITPIDSSTGISIGAPNAEIINTTIHGHDGWSIKGVDGPSGREYTTYLWFDLEHGYSFDFSAIGISDREVQKIFDNIVINYRMLKIY